MSKEFVIVIEADNKRAAAAYQKGLDDFDLVFPQLLQAAQERDDKAQAEYDADMAVKMERWHAEAPVLEVDGCWLPGRKERARLDWEHATELHAIRKPDRYDRGWSRRGRVDRLQSIRAELQRMADIAHMATGPYRMTEYQVAELISWENGQRVESLKREYLATSAE